MKKWFSTPHLMPIILSLVCLMLQTQAYAFGHSEPKHEVIEMNIGQSKRIAVTEAPHTFYLEDPAIADYTFHEPNLVIVEAKAMGETKFYSLNHDGQAEKIVTVKVSYPLTALRTVVKEAYPNAKIKIKLAADNVVVSGFVDNSTNSQQLRQTVAKYVPDDKIIMKVEFPDNPVNQAATQVNLKVRMVEVKRNATRALGIQWDGAVNNLSKHLLGFGFTTPNKLLGSPGEVTSITPTWQLNNKITINNVINLLEEETYATTMQEPNITAESGAPANFRVGGSVPVVIPATNPDESGTIEYREYGIVLQFTATVAGKMIELQVSPSVSFPNPENPSAPSFSTKEASTTVKLMSGQSMVLAGLVSSTTTADENAVPGMSGLPMVGNLFRSESVKRSEDEVVFIITPYIVHPTQDGMVQDPLDEAGMPRQGLNLTKPGFIIGWGE